MYKVMNEAAENKAAAAVLLKKQIDRLSSERFQFTSAQIPIDKLVDKTKARMGKDGVESYLVKQYETMSVEEKVALFG